MTLRATPGVRGRTSTGRSLKPQSDKGFGIPVKIVQGWLGHSEPGITQDMYLETHKNGDEEAWQQTGRPGGGAAAWSHQRPDAGWKSQASTSLGAGPAAVPVQEQHRLSAPSAPAPAHSPRGGGK